MVGFSSPILYSATSIPLNYTPCVIPLTIMHHMLNAHTVMLQIPLKRFLSKANSPSSLTWLASVWLILSAKVLRCLHCEWALIHITNLNTYNNLDTYLNALDCKARPAAIKHVCCSHVWGVSDSGKLSLGAWFCPNYCTTLLKYYYNFNKFNYNNYNMYACKLTYCKWRTRQEKLMSRFGLLGSSSAQDFVFTWLQMI